MFDGVLDGFVLRATDVVTFPPDCQGIANAFSTSKCLQFSGGYTNSRGKAMANYPQELAQDAVCQSHTSHMTGLWFLPSPAFKAEY